MDKLTKQCLNGLTVIVIVLATWNILLTTYAVHLMERERNGQLNREWLSYVYNKSVESERFEQTMNTYIRQNEINLQKLDERTRP